MCVPCPSVTHRGKGAGAGLESACRPAFPVAGLRHTAVGLPAAEDAIPGRAVSTGRRSFPALPNFLCAPGQRLFHSYLTVKCHADIGPAFFLVITSLHQVPSKGEEVILMTGKPGIGECGGTV